MKPEFPRIHQEGRAQESDGKLRFTWVNTLNQPVEETLPVLEPQEIMRMVQERMDRFASAPPGARESDASRGERKYIVAHATNHEDVLRAAFEQMDEHQRMEFEMMLDMRSHQGLEGPEEIARAGGTETPVGDDGQALGAAEEEQMSAVSSKQYGAMAAAKAGHSNLGIPQSVGAEFVEKTPPEKRSRFAKTLAKRRKRRHHSSATFDRLRQIAKG